MAAGATTIQYNGVTLWNVHTRRFDQESVFDDSGTDLIYHKYTIRVVGYVQAMAASAQTFIGLQGSGPASFDTARMSPDSAALNHKAVRHLLGSQRATFTMTTGSAPDGTSGTVLLTAKGANSGSKSDPPAITDIDVNNGPKSKVFSVSHVSADQVFRCEVEFEVCKLECGNATSGGNSGGEGTVTLNHAAVLSNRWTVADEIDKNMLTNRNYAGKLRLASANVDPNDFRGYVVPPVQPGFHRDGIHVTASLDGLALDWQILDKEIVYSAPQPATSWSYSHTESTGDGKMIYGTLDVTLIGDRTVDRGKLIILVANMVDGVLLYQSNFAALHGDKQPVVITEEFAISDDVSDDHCAVRGHARVMRGFAVTGDANAPADKTFRYIFARDLGQPLDQNHTAQQTGFADTNPLYDSNLSRGARMGDTDANDQNPGQPELSGPLTAATAFAVYLQDPCALTHAIIPNGTQLGTSNRYGNTGPAAELDIRVRSDLPKDSTDLQSADQITAPYIHYRLDSHFVGQQQRVQLPLAAPPQQSLGSGGTGNPNGGTSAPTLSQIYTNPTCAILSLTQPLYQREIRIEAQRVVSAPVFPEPKDILAADYSDDPNAPNMMLLSWRYVPQAPDATPDQQQLFVTAAEYVYALDRPPNFGTLAIGNPVWSNIGYTLADPNSLQGGVA